MPARGRGCRSTAPAGPVVEPGRSDGETAWPEVVIPTLEIDYVDVLIKLINEQPTSYRAADEPALPRRPAGSVHAEPIHQRVKQPCEHPELGVGVEEPERGRDEARALLHYTNWSRPIS